MTESSKRRLKEEYGDWQTNFPLALSICQMLKEQGVCPQVVIEPTCGKGNFVLAALATFESLETVLGIEINAGYLHELSRKLDEVRTQHRASIHLLNENVFNVNFKEIKASIHGKNILVLGNPPWVTNSKLGELNSINLPVKSNFKGDKGLDAMTGKGNFDIAENITCRMIELMEGEDAHLALLLKCSVIKNIIYEQGKKSSLVDCAQYNIDTEKEFAASVASALFTAKVGKGDKAVCDVFDFYTKESIKTFGWVDRCFVSDCEKYRSTQFVDGKSGLTWWSGLKHDCSNVLELSRVEGGYVNKMNEKVDVEEDLIYPFLKSSDLKGDAVTQCRKYVILTQRRTSENTDEINRLYPKTYQYLTSHLDYFERRKSSIYKNRPKFCIFGVGDYTFKKYRVAISGLYKQTKFSLVSDVGGKLALLDDTTYLLGFDNQDYAVYTLKLLNSDVVQHFIESVYFTDAKRPINKDLLMRIDLLAVLNRLGRSFLGISERQFDDYKLHLQPYAEGNLFTSDKKRQAS